MSERALECHRRIGSEIDLLDAVAITHVQMCRITREREHMIAVACLQKFEKGLHMKRFSNDCQIANRTIDVKAQEHVG